MDADERDQGAYAYIVKRKQWRASQGFAEVKHEPKGIALGSHDASGLKKVAQAASRSLLRSMQPCYRQKERIVFRRRTVVFPFE